MDVLIVDDELLVQGIVAESLLDEGLHVVTAASAEAALARADAEGGPTVVVTDVNLGDGMDGFMLAAEVQRRWPAVGVVIMSGDPTNFLRHEITERERLLQKPFDCTPLVNAVRGLMARPTR